MVVYGALVSSDASKQEVKRHTAYEALHFNHRKEAKEAKDKW